MRAIALHCHSTFICRFTLDLFTHLLESVQDSSDAVADCSQGRATVDIGNDENQSPLHVAAHEAAFDCVRLLIQHGKCG